MLWQQAHALIKPWHSICSRTSAVSSSTVCALKCQIGICEAVLHAVAGHVLMRTRGNALHAYAWLPLMGFCGGATPLLGS